MQFVYGSYPHTPNSVSFDSFSRNWIQGQSGRVNRLHVEWNLKGKLLSTAATNQMADIMNQLSVLQLAYSIGGQNAAMLDNNGNVIGPWYLNSSQSLGGVVVTNPVSHQDVRGAQGTTYLWYTFGLSADFIAAPGLMSYSETVVFQDIGGGPLLAERVPVQGLPIQQTVTSNSWFHCTQSGSLTQNTAGPVAQPPYFPGNIRGNDSAKGITFLPTNTIRGAPYEWGIAWQYDFISATSFAFGGAVVRG